MKENGNPERMAAVGEAFSPPYTGSRIGIIPW